MYYILEKTTGQIIYTLPVTSAQKLAPRQIYKYFDPAFHKMANEHTLETARNICGGKYIIENRKILMRAGRLQKQQLDLIFVDADVPPLEQYVLANYYLDQRVINNTYNYPLKCSAELVINKCNYVEIAKHIQDPSYEPHFATLCTGQMYLEDFLDKNYQYLFSVATVVASNAVLLEVDTDYPLKDFSEDLLMDSQIQALKIERANEFLLFDKYQLSLYWAELTADKQAEYIQWRDAWRDVTKTLTPPERPTWFQAD